MVGQADATFGLHSSEYIALPALKGMDGKQYVFSDPDHYNYGRNEILITNKSKNPAKLLKWLDKLYTDEASIQNFYGSFGIATERMVISLKCYLLKMVNQLMNGHGLIHFEILVLNT